jgi:hypothetical protein
VRDTPNRRISDEGEVRSAETASSHLVIDEKVISQLQEGGALTDLSKIMWAVSNSLNREEMIEEDKRLAALTSSLVFSGSGGFGEPGLALGWTP